VLQQVSYLKVVNHLTGEFIWNKPVLDEYTRPAELRG